MKRNRPTLAILTNFIPPTRLPSFECIARHIGTTVLVDANSEPNRHWSVNHGSLAVEVVCGITVQTRYVHAKGFSEKSFLHVPAGVLWRLFALRPDYVISGELGFRTAAASLYRFLRPSTRLALWVEGTPHTDSCRGVVRHIWRRVVLRAADTIVAAGSGTKRLLSSYGVRPERIVVSYLASGFGPPECPPLRDPIQRRRLLYAGQFVSRKGLRQFMEALVRVCERMPSTNVEMWLVGQGEEERRLKSLPLPASLSLRFHEPVGLNRMPEIYSQCGVLVFPTLADVWGLVVNEAMAYSMPVLGSRYAQSVCDLVREGENGWTYVPDDEAGAESAIRAALSARPAELERMGACARETVRELTPERFGLDLLHAAVGERSI